MTPLSYAAQVDAGEVAALLMAHGADKEAQNDVSLLQQAVRHIHHSCRVLSVIRRLHEA